MAKVTYRLLSRLVGVHVNLAKQCLPYPMSMLMRHRMLHEFHQQAKADGKACHATYILGGLVQQAPLDLGDAMHIDGDDFPMSSPFATQESGTSANAIAKTIREVMLADEDDVQGTQSGRMDLTVAEAKNRFTELTSIHVYSLGPAIVKDPILLTTCSYDINKQYDSTMSPAEIAEKYGVIANPNAVVVISYGVR